MPTYDKQGNIMGGWFTSANEATLNAINTDVEVIGNHIHGHAKCYPTEADPIRVSTTSSAWGVLSAASVVIAASVLKEIWSAADAPSSPWDMHFAVISDISANGYYEIAFYTGAAGSETKATYLPFTRSATSREGAESVLCPVIPAGTRLSMGLTSNNAAINSVTVKVIYHEY